MGWPRFCFRQRVGVLSPKQRADVGKLKGVKDHCHRNRSRGLIAQKSKLWFVLWRKRFCAKLQVCALTEALLCKIASL